MLTSGLVQKSVYVYINEVCSGALLARCYFEASEIDYAIDQLKLSNVIDQLKLSNAIDQLKLSNAIDQLKLSNCLKVFPMIV